MSNIKFQKYKKIFSKMSGCCLDVGCGLFKQKGFVGLDQVPHKNVDIQHDIQEFPWPVPDSICHKILLSHVWEHVEPKYRFQLMDELWRIIRYDGQLFIACPYAGSFLEYAHPAHYNCPNEATFQFFDPVFRLWHSCSYKKPLPWKIVSCEFCVGGNIELLLEPRKTEKGEMLMPVPGEPVVIKDECKVVIQSKKDKEENARKLNNNNQERSGRESKE